MVLSKELFDDVIVYSMSEIGAMGACGLITCLKKNGESFTLNYLSEETPWGEIKKYFPGINGCCFNGPRKEEKPFTNVVEIGREPGEKDTKINPGWCHLWLDMGHHLVCKEEYFAELKKQLEGIENCVITFDWVEILEKGGFIHQIN